MSLQLGVVGLSLVLVPLSPARLDTEVERQVLAPLLTRDGDYTISLHGQRIACAVGTPDGRGAIVIDGETSEPFDGLVDPRMVLVSQPPEIVAQDALQARLHHSEKRGKPVVVFSDDGSRTIWAVQRGADVVVTVDGREIWKAPAAGGQVSGLDFSPGAKLAYFVRHPVSDAEDGFQLVVDGKMQRKSYLQPFPVFDTSGTRYAYVATDLDRKTHHLIVDGEEAPYVGLRPQWTSDGRLVTIAPKDTASDPDTVLLDGEPLLKAAVVERVLPAPAGGRLATLTRGGGTRQLWIDGETVSDGPAIEAVHWSPDGERWAAVCDTGRGTRFLLLDGEPGPEFATLTDVTFSEDGSHVHFTGYANGQFVVVIDNERQTPASALAIQPRVNAAGDLAFVLGRNQHDMALLLGDKTLGPMREAKHLTLSPVGTRYALAFGPLNDTSVLVDGMIFDDVETKPFVANGMAATEGERFVFSPDGTHLAYLGWLKANPRAMGVFVDDVLIPTSSTNVSRLQFTPDSRHVVWVERVKPHMNVMVDGRLVAQLDLSTSSLWERHENTAAMSPDGVFTIVGPSQGSLVRLRIRPDETRTVDAMVAEARGR